MVSGRRGYSAEPDLDYFRMVAQTRRPACVVQWHMVSVRAFCVMTSTLKMYACKSSNQPSLACVDMHGLTHTHTLWIPEVAKLTICASRELAQYTDITEDVVTAIDAVEQNNYSTVGGDGGCRVGKVRAGTTSPMPDNKGFKL